MKRKNAGDTLRTGINLPGVPSVLLWRQAAVYSLKIIFERNFALVAVNMRSGPNGSSKFIEDHIISPTVRIKRLKNP